MKYQRNKFKDKCDICGKFDYLKGHENKCLCQNCITYAEIEPNLKKNLKQLTIFDMEGINIDKRKKNDYFRSSK